MDQTEKKILDAALKVFAEKGYEGAKTKLIAKESGFTEMTLFRKFGSKENLFNQVLTANFNKIAADYEETNLISIEKSGNLEKLIKSIITLFDNNFEYIHILLNEDHKSEVMIKEGLNKLVELIKKIAPGLAIDYEVIAFNLMAFSYFIIFNRRHGNPFVDYDTAVEEFIKWATDYMENNWIPSNKNQEFNP